MLFVGRFSFLNVLIEFFLLASRGPFARQVNNVAKVAVEFIGSVFGGARGDDCTLFQRSFFGDIGLTSHPLISTERTPKTSGPVSCTNGIQVSPS